MMTAATRSGARSRWLSFISVLVGVVMAPVLALAANIDLPVPRTTIYPGDVISADQLMDRAFIANTVSRSSIFDHRSALIGKVARRTLLPGQPVPVNAIRDAYLVSQGKASMVVFESGGLNITMHAVALDNGVAGDIVKLRNPDSGVIIQGTVERDGTVRLGAQ